MGHNRIVTYIDMICMCVCVCVLMIVGSMKYAQEKGGLRIHSLQPEDSGAYECRAEVASQGNLKVQTINLDVICALNSFIFQLCLCVVVR